MLKKMIVALIFVAAGAVCFAADSQPKSKVQAYYFHATMRCPTCLKLEQYSREAIENNFKDALASGKLEFKAVNVDEKNNEHFVRDYQLYTRSLVLSLVKENKEVKSKNLTKIWEYVGNKQKFYEYVKQEVQDLLKEL
jgi:hypothetical protein